MSARLVSAPLGLFLALLGPIAPLQAEPWACQFTVTCPAGLACTDHDAAAEIIAADHEGQLFLSLDGQDLITERLGTDGSAEEARYAAHGTGLTVLLSIRSDGTAWLSRHDSEASTLFGRCETGGS